MQGPVHGTGPWLDLADWMRLQRWNIPVPAPAPVATLSVRVRPEVPDVLCVFRVQIQGEAGHAYRYRCRRPLGTVRRDPRVFVSPVPAARPALEPQVEDRR
jgi:hypothetical protein